MPNKWGGFWYCSDGKGYGPWVINVPENLLGLKTRSSECVALAQETLGMPLTKTWREGEKVFGGNLIVNGERFAIPKGAVIATFIDGLYPSNAHGNHVAIYLSQTKEYIEVIDQWNGRKPGKRKIVAKEGMSDRSNNANAFSLVYTLP